MDIDVLFCLLEVPVSITLSPATADATVVRARLSFIAKVAEPFFVLVFAAAHRVAGTPVRIAVLAAIDAHAVEGTHCTRNV